jgi:quercetin dioxygenase-like cupin family protein
MLRRPAPPEAPLYLEKYLQLFPTSKTEVDVKELEPTIDQSLYQNRKDFPTVVVYEITTEQNGLPFGVAMADITVVEPHFHKVTVETYTIVQGDLEVSLNSEQHILHPGDVIKISPGIVHSARSLDETPARITVSTIPEFSQADYYLAE